MIVSASIRFKDVLRMLAVESIPGCEDAPDDKIDFIECVEVDETDIPQEVCDLCDGEGVPDPEEVDPFLVADFIRAIKTGDIPTAQCLVGRVFPQADDVRTIDLALCRCAA
jgi:hypothetical protein